MQYDFIHDARLQLGVSLFLITLLIDVLLRRLVKRSAGKERSEHAGLGWRDVLLAAIGPISFLVWYYGIYGGIALAAEIWPAFGARIGFVITHGRNIGVIVALSWFFYRLAGFLDRQLQAGAARSDSRVNTILLPLLGTAVRVMLPIVALFILLRLWPIPPDFEWVFQKLTAIGLIVALSWTLRRAVVLSEHAILGGRDVQSANSFEGRAIYTRVSLLRKMALFFIGLFAFAAILMMFEEVRDVGRSILASAGIAGIIIGFAAQKSLANLLAGLQIALTQPIRLGDQVLVSGEVGTIEEITLTYVVVRVWDLRRLIVPINYFNENTFQNWSRTSVNLLSPVTVRADFTLPVPAFRGHMEQVVKKSKKWDGKVFAVQVTAADHYSIELRILASAANSGDSFDLQCEIREQAIDFIHRQFPQSLPKAREEGKPISAWQLAEETRERPQLPSPSGRDDESDSVPHAEAVPGERK
jgi:small-conductance mechanosensitive channel